jgi:hypothetical protein
MNVLDYRDKDGLRNKTIERKLPKEIIGWHHPII